MQHLLEKSCHELRDLTFEVLLLLTNIVFRRFVVFFEPVTAFAERGFDGIDVEGGGDLWVCERLLDLVCVVFKLLTSLERFLTELIFGLVLLGIGNHLFDIIGIQSTAVVLDLDTALATGGLVLCGDVEDTVGIDLERNFQLGLTLWHGDDTGEFKLSHQVVILCEVTFSFVHWELDLGLVVPRRCEHGCLQAWDGRVSGDDDSHDTTLHLDTEREWDNIEEEHIACGLGFVTGKHGRLDGGTVRNGFVGVDGFVEFLTIEKRLEERLDFGDTCGSTNEHDVVNLALWDTRVLNNLLDGFETAQEEVLAQFFELGTGDLELEIFAVHQCVDLDGCGGDGREGTLCSLACRSKTTHSTGACGDVLAGLGLKHFLDVVEETVVEILTTKVGITSCGLDGEHTRFDGQKRHIEGTTTEIKDENGTFLEISLGFTLGGHLFTETVRDGGGCGFVDDTKDVESTDTSSVLGGLTLSVVEIRWDRNNGVFNGFTEVCFRCGFHLAENHGTDFFWCVLGGFLCDFDRENWLGFFVNNRERPVLHITLD
eukprot:m.255958 g.255958  ORF g.255958 m.255958 type:complete len:541 (-) comp33994_c0_seq1:342-1964(-)